MKCRKCGTGAVIQMRQHHLALCGEHFNSWFLEHCAATIRKFRMVQPGERVLVAVSGGKDSLGLWDALSRLGYHVDGLTIDLGIDEGTAYSIRSLDYTREFAASRGLLLHELYLPAEYGRSVPEMFSQSRHGEEKPCSVCGLVKRHEMNRFARQHGYAVLATGHNLDDEASVLLTNNLAWNATQLGRQYPAMEGSGGFARRIKPFARFYERETTAYTLLNRIAYIEEECPFSAGSRSNELKVLLNTMEHDQPGLKYQYFNQFITAKKTGLLNFSVSREYVEMICPQCGQPTSSAEKCAFCRLVGAVD